MNNYTQKFFLITFFFLSDFVMFAQGDDDDGGCLECADPAPAPINSQLILLLIVGVLFAFYIMKNNRKTT